VEISLKRGANRSLQEVQHIQQHKPPLQISKVESNCVLTRILRLSNMSRLQGGESCLLQTTDLNPNHATSAGTTTPTWIQETLESAKNDHRKQPWKHIFGEDVDCRFDAGKDLVKVERRVGVDLDPDCPFKTQGSSLAA